MDEYIKREDAIDAVLDVYCDTPDIDLSCEKFEAAILKIQAADVAPMRHGRWIWHSEERGYLCSECGSGCLLNYESDWHKSDWCPHCGADMRGINDE